MLLQNKNAVVYGAGGVVGGAVARAFAREGATVFLAGRTVHKLEVVAKEITAEGGQAFTAQVDALDKQAVDAHADAVVERVGRIDISFNAIGIDHVQGVPLRELSLDDYLLPIMVYTTTQFLTSAAAARHMSKNGSGVILMLSTTASRVAVPSDGFGVACAGIESLSRELAGELGPHGVRVVCLRPDAIPETVALDSHVRDMWARAAEYNGATLEQLLAGTPGPRVAAGLPGALLGRSPTLADVAGTAVFLASDLAGGLTGSITTVSCGALVD